jgi:MinD-like ATPase involved in chromosome partitioning or flagellar assembly
MPLFVLTSAKGSPGTTSLALGLAVELGTRLGSSFPAAFLVDADPDGGDTALYLGLAAAPSVGTLALAGRHGFNEAVLVSHCQRSRLLSGVAVLVGVAGRGQRAAVSWLAEPLAAAARSIAVPVVIDAGRVSSIDSARALFLAADKVVVCCSPSTASIVHARSALVSLAAEGIVAGVVMVGPMREPPEEIAGALGHSLLANLKSPPRWSWSRPVPRGRPPEVRHPELQRLASVLLGDQHPLALPAQPIFEHAPLVAPGQGGQIERRPTT